MSPAKRESSSRIALLFAYDPAGSSPGVCFSVNLCTLFRVMRGPNWPIARGLTSLPSDKRFVFEKRLPRDQIPRCRCECQEVRPHLYRRRRLDLRALARGVLSGEARAIEGVAVRRLEAHFDRDQWHLLRLAEAGELSQ